MRDCIMAELNGEIAPEQRITQLDSVVLPPVAPPETATPTE